VQVEDDDLIMAADKSGWISRGRKYLGVYIIVNHPQSRVNKTIVYTHLSVLLFSSSLPSATRLKADLIVLLEKEIIYYKT
jgi:hypothetical protein